MYRLNADDCISYYDNPQTALSSHQPTTANDLNPIGKSIWDFITEPNTVALYHHMIDRVRSTGQFSYLTICFQCSADIKDCGKLLVSSINKDIIEFSVHHVPFKATNCNRIVRDSRSSNTVTICGWCDTITVNGIDWFSWDGLVYDPLLFHRPMAPRFSHGMCEQCRDGMLNSLQKIPIVQAS